MKTSTKAILSSVVVIALCLSAVGGVTYSWFSDSEETTVTVNSAQMDLLVDVGTPSVSSGLATISPIAPDDSYTIENLAANVQISIPYKTSYKSTIPVVYRTILVLGTTDNMMDYDYQNIFVNGKALSTASTINDEKTIVLDGPGSVPANATRENWNTDPTTYTELKDGDIVISTPTTYGDKDDIPEGWSSSESRWFTFTIKTELYQGDYDGFERVVINSSTPIGTTTFTIDSSNSTPTSTSVQASGSATVGTSTIPYKVELDQNITSGAVASGPDRTELIVTVDETPSAFSVNDIGVNVSLKKYTTGSPEGTPVDFNGGTADITVTVPGIIEDPVVRYVGEGEQPTLISSSTDAANNTTTVVFRTTHFSKFVVSERNGGAVNVSTYEDLCKYLESLRNVTINVTTDLTAPAEALDITMEGGANIKLNLGDNTIDLGAATIVVKNGKLTINSGENGAIESTYCPINATGNSTVTINGGSFSSSTNDNPTLAADGSSKVIVKDGTFKGDIALYSADDSDVTIHKGQFTGVEIIVYSKDNSNIDILGGTFESDKTISFESSEGYGIIASGNSTIHIDDATLNAGDDYGIHTAFGSTSKIVIDNGTFHNTAQVLINVGVFSTSSIEINGGEFTTDNRQLIDVQGGSLTINGGEFTVENTEQVSYIISYSTFDGCTTKITGGKFSIIDKSDSSSSFSLFYSNGSSTELSDTSMQISGGTFTVKAGTNSTGGLFSYGSNDYFAQVITGGTFVILDKEGNASDTIVSGYYDHLGQLTCGKFNFDPSKASFRGTETNYVASGYTAQDNGDGTYTIVPVTSP